MLYRPVEALAREFPGVTAVHNLDDALVLLEDARRKLEENGTL